MNHQYEAALDPEQLARFFVARANQGDVEGTVALYEPDAVLACPDGSIAKGRQKSASFMLN
jgi:ketosteroid isomerase-like protein